MVEIIKPKSVSEELIKPKKVDKGPFEVRNVTEITLNLSMGKIERNDIGWATAAEVSTLEPAYIVRT